MINLFHGSTSIIEHPLANVGREDLDFGRGFYVTQFQEQAERWAVRMQLIHQKHQAWINTYTFDYEAVKRDGFHILQFDAYNHDWLEFIVKSRNGEKPWIQYDVIEGGVANDKVIDTVEDYIEGVITEEQALGNLIFAKPNHQICILNQLVIDRYLIYKGSVLLNQKSL